MKDPALTHMEEACQDLLYPSESDEPFTVFESEEEPPECHALDAVWLSVEQFFADLEGERFEYLRSVLEREVDNIHIARVGKGPRVGIILFGRSPQTFKFIGARTVSVET